MNPAIAIGMAITDLETLAETHPEIVGLIARTVEAAAKSTSPARAIVRHLVREAAEGASDELADELSKMTNPEQ